MKTTARHLSHRQLLDKVAHLTKEVERLQKLAFTDELTGLYNRRAYNEMLEMVHKSALQGENGLGSYAVAYIDIDNFKKINDVYGHDVGDAILKKFAQIVKEEKRSNQSERLSDVAFRYGGEEFVVVMPNTDRKGARNFTTRLHSAIEDHLSVTYKKGAERGTVSATVSIGVAVWNGVEQSGQLLARADRVLLNAKRNGRNHMRMHGDT